MAEERNSEKDTINSDNDMINISSIEGLDENLHVNVYDQSQLEANIISKVDNALSEAERNFKSNIILTEIKNLEKEKSHAQNEKDEIDKVFRLAEESDSSYPVSFSLLQKRKSKETQLQKVDSEINAKVIALKELQDSHKQDNNKGKTNSGLLDGTDSHADAVRLGEITPFDSLNKAKTSDLSNVSEENHFKKKNIQKKKESNDGSTSDEDYCPDEEMFDDNDEFDEIFVEKETKDHKTIKKVVLKSSLKYKKIIDDGDFNSFKDRLKRIVAIKRAKEACRAGETQEEYHSSDFSDDTDEEDNVKIEDSFVLPRKLWMKLYKYQRVGIKWLWQLHRKDVGGIIADEMGLGKTIQVISFLAGLSTSYKITKQIKFKLGAILIVCPATVMHQWVAEFHKWWPNFRVAILHDSGSFNGRKATLVRAINQHPGILVTSYAGMRMNKSELYRYTWQYVILDEGHKIRNPDADITLACKHFESTNHRIILSGTPLQNSLKELWSLFDFVYPGKLGTLQVFMAEFSVPITMGGYVNASSVQVQTAYKCSCILRDTIGPYILRRLKKDVQNNIELPSKNEQVLFCKLSDEQRDIYQQYINSPEVENMLKGQMKIFAGLIKLRKICNHPDLAFLPPVGSKQKKGESSNNALQLSEEHKFVDGYGFWKRSGKMIVVEALLKIWKNQNHRVLIFTQSRQMLQILEGFVKAYSYTYLTMDGTTNVGARQGLVKKFNEDKSIFLFLLTTRVGGIGLNLIGANRVVIFDPDWNPSTDSQARERSWRIGQTKDVTIYRLMTTGTIEEKIYHRQIFKQFLANRILTNPLQRRFFKSNDLYELFTLGDIGPKQTSETGAIFAGTGSVIKFRQKSSKPSAISDKTSSLTSGDNSSSSACLVGKIAPLQTTINCKEKMKENVISPHTKRRDNTRKKSRKRKIKPMKIDGHVVDNLVKLEKYKKKSQENTEEESESKNIKTEKDVLLSLFLSSGIHSALKHDKIEQSSRPDYVLVEREAERVAKQAVDALRKSRENYRINSASPSGLRQAKKENLTSRFGKKKSQLISIPTTAKVTISSSSSLDLSSSALLERMRKRNLCSDNDSTMQQSNIHAEQLDSVHQEFNEHEVLISAQQYLNEQPLKSSTTENIIDKFKTKVPNEKTAVFKELLQQICTFSRNDDKIGMWTLNEEFHT